MRCSPAPGWPAAARESTPSSPPTARIRPGWRRCGPQAAGGGGAAAARRRASARPAGRAAVRAAGGGADAVIGSTAAPVGAAALAVAGLLGIGGRGGLRPPYDDLAAMTAASDALVVAVD